MRYFLDSDDDGHWYLVPEDKRVEWYAWFDSDEYADGVEPDFVTRLDSHPNLVTFSDPILAGE